MDSQPVRRPSASSLLIKADGARHLPRPRIRADEMKNVEGNSPLGAVTLPEAGSPEATAVAIPNRWPPPYS